MKQRYLSRATAEAGGVLGGIFVILNTHLVQANGYSTVCIVRRREDRDPRPSEKPVVRYVVMSMYIMR